jgi:hypothetical protein
MPPQNKTHNNPNPPNSKILKLFSNKQTCISRNQMNLLQKKPNISRNYSHHDDEENNNNNNRKEKILQKQQQ